MPPPLEEDGAGSGAEVDAGIEEAGGAIEEGAVGGESNGCDALGALLPG